MSDWNKSIVLPVFSGNEEDFQLWKTKFMAFTTTKGCEATLMGNETDLPVKQQAALDESNPDEKKQIKAKDWNSLAMT